MLKLKVCEKSSPESRLPFLTSLLFNLPPVVLEQRLNGASVFLDWYALSNINNLFVLPEPHWHGFLENLVY